MTAEQQTVVMIRGVIASLPADEKAKVDKAVAEIRELMTQLGEHSYMAIALIGAEIAAD